jgi:phytoene/squalene synthetase
MQMVALPVKDQLRTWGPSAAVSVSSDEAVAYCRALARTHGENFPVLSTLVPARLRDDFAVVYSFCRWADDLADELGDVDEATSMLAWGVGLVV